MIPNVMHFKSMAVIAFSRVMIKSHLKNHKDHSLNPIALQFLDDTLALDIDNYKKLHRVTLKAYQILAKEYTKVMDTYQSDDEYSPIILAFDLLDEWFNSGKALISLPDYLKDYEFTAVLDIAVDHHGGWEDYIKTSRVLSKALCKKLLSSSCV